MLQFSSLLKLILAILEFSKELYLVEFFFSTIVQIYKQSQFSILPKQICFFNTLI